MKGEMFLFFFCPLRGFGRVFIVMVKLESEKCLADFVESRSEGGVPGAGGGSTLAWSLGRRWREVDEESFFWESESWDR